MEKRWSFWDRIAYACVAISAVGQAVNQALKDASGEAVTTLLASAWWNYAPLVLVVLSALIFIAQRFGWVGRALPFPSSNSGALELITERHFRHMTIAIDGKSFVKCTFDSCILQYAGGNWQFTECTHKGQFGVEAGTQPVSNTMQLLRYVEKLGKPLDSSMSKEPRPPSPL